MLGSLMPIYERSTLIEWASFPLIFKSTNMGRDHWIVYGPALSIVPMIPFFCFLFPVT